MMHATAYRERLFSSENHRKNTQLMPLVAARFAAFSKYLQRCNGAWCVQHGCGAWREVLLAVADGSVDSSHSETISLRLMPPVLSAINIGFTTSGYAIGRRTCKIIIRLAEPAFVSRKNDPHLLDKESALGTFRSD